jgi:8-oxo-dGTP pyrophosphatase MutT (NUDIX family)
MIRRHAGASFVPGVWVFPGGMLEELDREIARARHGGSFLAAMKVAAMRELFEETGVWLGTPLEEPEPKRRRLLAGSLAFRNLLAESPVEPERLVWTSRWITPDGVPKRFDTYFFLTVAPEGAIASLVNDEAVEIIWARPEHAIAELKMVFPTIRNLEAVCGFESIDALLESRRGVEIPPVQPVIVDGRITLP